jgi:hypothetical protein
MGTYVGYRGGKTFLIGTVGGPWTGWLGGLVVGLRALRCADHV